YVRTQRSDGLCVIQKDALALLTGMRYEHDTIVNRAIAVRISIPEPAKITTNLNLTATLSGTEVTKTKTYFAKWFKNKFAVIHFEQRGSWGQPVTAIAKVDLTGMNSKNLYFYHYDKATKKYSLIENPAYTVDKSGYVHFTTPMAGDIIISDGKLTKK
ncbi:hypothetical protein LJC63_08545, partial [Ruminococcaceae bacterium OttesenSCG-928-L11]|nr:hypothetical protein [Ruminococcaceae bacterium OttesenSCG-928-L11]